MYASLRLRIEYLLPSLTNNRQRPERSLELANLTVTSYIIF